MHRPAPVASIVFATLLALPSSAAEPEATPGDAGFTRGKELFVTMRDGVRQSTDVLG